MSPKLSAALKKPITIELRDAPVRNVFELISQRSGMNFVYDKDIPADARATVFVRDTSIEDVIKFVLVTNQLEQRVLNENTLLIYPNTPQKAQAYKELVMKSFFLANADVKQTANLVRSLVKTRDLFVDEKLNLLVVRDTPEAIRTVEKLLASHDIGEPEVMLEVEVLEVGYSTLTNLGIQWPGSAALSVIGAAGVPGQITGTEAKNFGSGNVRLTFSDPLLALNLRQQAGRTSVLANPRIRVKSKEKARIHIGDRVPVITTTAGATGFVSESVNYLDVGLKLEVEPLVNLEDDVGIKVGLEVSNISQENRTPAGTVSYQVGTRNAATTLQAARRRDAGARRPDQRRGPPRRHPGAGPRQPAARSDACSRTTATPSTRPRSCCSSRRACCAASSGPRRAWRSSTPAPSSRSAAAAARAARNSQLVLARSRRSPRAAAAPVAAHAAALPSSRSRSRCSSRARRARRRPGPRRSRSEPGPQ